MESNTAFLLSLECPFTWNLSEDVLNIDYQIDYDLEHAMEFCPLLMLMYDLMAVYVRTQKEDRCLEDVLCGLNKCDINMSYLEAEAHPQISISVARHILQASKAHVFHKFELNEKLERLRAVITHIDLEDYKSRSTLQACKSQAWSKCDVNKAISFSEKAIEQNPDCDLWYYVLGKDLRRKRRDASVNQKPSEKEKECMEKSYKISRNSFYGVFLAQMYRESRDYNAATSMYNEIFNSINFESDNAIIILLKLALGFIRMKSMGKAKICLCYVSERMSESHPLFKLYNHYQGIYYLEKQQFREAVTYLERAITQKDIAVEKDYLKCKSRIRNEPFDTTKYLENMLKKYESLHESQKQWLYLELALSYWKKENNIEQALDNFLHALEINPTARILTNYTPCINGLIRHNNILRVVKKELLTPEFYDRFESDEKIIKKANTLNDFCS